MRPLFAAVLLALAALPAAADPVTVPEGQFADLKVDVPKGASVVWQFATPPTRKAADLPPGRAIFTGVPGKTYSVMAMVIDFDAKTVTPIDFEVTFLGKAPTPPPPPPGPTPDPTPTPTPDPIVGEGLNVLFVYEKDDLAKLPSAQLAALYSAEVTDYLNAKCAKGSDGKTPEWRKWDQNQDVSKAPAAWKAALARPRKSLPWVSISTTRATFEGPLPATVEDTLALLRKYGGN